jgi:hypothetical protein
MQNDVFDEKPARTRFCAVTGATSKIQMYLRTTPESLRQMEKPAGSNQEAIRYLTTQSIDHQNPG